MRCLALLLVLHAAHAVSILPVLDALMDQRPTRGFIDALSAYAAPYKGKRLTKSAAKQEVAKESAALKAWFQAQVGRCPPGVAARDDATVRGVLCSVVTTMQSGDSAPLKEACADGPAGLCASDDAVGDAETTAGTARDAPAR